MRKVTVNSERLRLRCKVKAKQILQLAAAATQQSVSEFILESALTRAEEVLLDRQRFGLTAERWEAFHRALGAPSKRLPRAARLLRERGVFDQGQGTADAE